MVAVLVGFMGAGKTTVGHIIADDSASRSSTVTC